MLCCAMLCYVWVFALWFSAGDISIQGSYPGRTLGPVPGKQFRSDTGGSTLGMFLGYSLYGFRRGHEYLGLLPVVVIQVRYLVRLQGCQRGIENIEKLIGFIDFTHTNYLVTLKFTLWFSVVDISIQGCYRATSLGTVLGTNCCTLLLCFCTSLLLWISL